MLARFLSESKSYLSRLGWHREQGQRMTGVVRGDADARGPVRSVRSADVLVSCL